jgi:glycosyltransferase involved in cell wall biosynthesis
MKKKVCLVTSEIIGPHKNGGIGAHAYYLAQVLAEKNYEVTVLYTGVCENKTSSYWIEYFKKIHIRYIQLDELVKQNFAIYEGRWFIDRSQFVYEFLQKNDFDHIHFQEMLANGFKTIRAKKLFNEFSNTLLTVTMHSSIEWIKQAMNWVKSGPSFDPKLEWCERYCCENCDILISPSKYMIDWAIDNGWKLADNRKVIPYCFEESVKIALNRDIDLKHLIFFGRLETRKGLEIFCDAVLQARHKYPDLIDKVSFLGKIWFINDTKGDQYIINKLGKKGINYEIFSDFSSFEALEYLKQQNGVAVMPSLMENFPYTVIESIENNIFFIASTAGGIPELANDDILFEPNVNALIDKIIHLDDIFNKKIIHKYSKEKAKKKWLKLHN